MAKLTDDEKGRRALNSAAIMDRAKVTASGEITADTRFSEVCRIWRADLDKQGKRFSPLAEPAWTACGCGKWRLVSRIGS